MIVPDSRFAALIQLECTGQILVALGVVEPPDWLLPCGATGGLGQINRNQASMSSGVSAPPIGCGVGEDIATDAGEPE